MPKHTHDIDPNALFILAFCSMEGPPRFIPHLKMSEIQLLSWEEAHQLGELALTKREQRAYQVWAVGPTYQSEVTIVQRDLPAI